MEFFRLVFDDLHGKPGQLCTVPDVPALLGTGGLCGPDYAIPDGGARGSARTFEPKRAP
jgi:hypothetical protein